MGRSMAPDQRGRRPALPRQGISGFFQTTLSAVLSLPMTVIPSLPCILAGFLPRLCLRSYLTSSSARLTTI